MKIRLLCVATLAILSVCFCRVQAAERNNALKSLPDAESFAADMRLVDLSATTSLKNDPPIPCDRHAATFQAFADRYQVPQRVLTAVASAALTMTGCGSGVAAVSPLLASVETVSFAPSRVGVAVLGDPIVFTNSTGTDIQLRSPQVTGDDFRIASNTCELLLRAKTSCAARVSFTPAATGVRDGTLSLPTQNQSATVTLRGIGAKPALLVSSASAIGFPDTLLSSTSSPQQITYTNTGELPASTQLNVQGSFKVQTGDCTGPLAPGGSCSVRLTFVPQARGSSTGSIEATTGNQTVTTVLTGTGLSPAHMSLSPTESRFADQRVQLTSAPVTLVLVNDGDVASPIGMMNTTGDFSVLTHTCSSPLLAHSQCEFLITFCPTAAGTRVGTAWMSAGPSTLTALLSGVAMAADNAVQSTTAAAAARLLDQAAFGPTIGDIEHVRQLGIPAFLNEQVNTPLTQMPQFPGNVGPPCDSTETCWGSDWWRASVTSPDQLRQRVAFALSHIFVTSTRTVGGYAMVPYYNMLLADAFGNWRKLMQDVTLSPVMGIYLNMVNSGKGAHGLPVNENFARENLQLFNIGTVLLNNDGTRQTDSQGRLVPAYTQEQVKAFARAFTGWTYWPRWGQTLDDFQPDPQDVSVYVKPMVPIAKQHDTDAKMLLNGTVLSAGQSAEQDLRDALDNIFQHPNLPPFVSRQLIQNLVTSNPSAAYVARVANVFINNGSGVRGDLQAVVTAILLDPEARAGDTDGSSEGGHLREPLLYIASVLRALPYTPEDTVDPWGYWAVSWSSGSVGQAPMQAPSVFYYYAPSHLLPGTTQTAPEFGIENVASISSQKVLTDQLIYGSIAHMQLDWSRDPTLLAQAADPDKLADELSLRFLHSHMPVAMRQILVDTITPIQDPMQRLRVALNLVLTSSFYKVIH